MIEFLAALACAVAIEAREDNLLRLRPACPVAYAASREAVGSALARAGGRSVTLQFGRLADYPWLSTLLTRQASASRHWNEDVEPNGYVRRALLGMPEFTSLFDPPWRIEGVAVEKVLLKAAGELDLARGHPIPPERLLPYDAMVSVKLSR